MIFADRQGLTGGKFALTMLWDGAKTATGQVLRGVRPEKCLWQLRMISTRQGLAGIAAGLKNTGVGNGMVDDSEVLIKIISGKRVEIHHGWSEMGQGVHTMAIQTLHQETGIDPSMVEVISKHRSRCSNGYDNLFKG
jgi:CO/xanthine dehydrogenase Mo-binding subunit